jgi:hypothetical protein
LKGSEEEFITRWDIVEGNALGKLKKEIENLKIARETITSEIMIEVMEELTGRDYYTAVLYDLENCEAPTKEDAYREGLFELGIIHVNKLRYIHVYRITSMAKKGSKNVSQ